MEGQNYSCGNCGYKFTPKNPAKVPENCPYCNKPETLERVKSAQDYLNEAKASIQEREERQA